MDRETKSGSHRTRRMPSVGLTLAIVASALLGYTADALAKLVIREDGGDCFVCLDLTIPGGTCNAQNADFERNCSDGDKASCNFTDADGFTSSCGPASLRPL